MPGAVMVVLGITMVGTSGVKTSVMAPWWHVESGSHKQSRPLPGLPASIQRGRSRSSTHFLLLLWQLTALQGETSWV
jgi:hypothetical protein